MRDLIATAFLAAVSLHKFWVCSTYFLLLAD